MWLENSPYPQDARVRNEALALADAGHRVTVVAPRRRDQMRSEMVGPVEVRRYLLPVSGDGAASYLLEYGIALIRIFLATVWLRMRGRIDVIHAHNPPDVLVFAALPFTLFGTRFVFDHHDLSPEMYEARFPEGSRKWLRRGLEWTESITFRVADHVISTNESYRSIALGRGRKAPDEVTVVRNGPDMARVVPVAPDDAIRARASLLIGYVGELGYQDGVDHLITALAHLRDDLGETDFHCFVIGRGMSLESLKQQVIDLELTGHVTFTGRISDEELMRTLSTVDICVDPDPSNPFNDRSSMIKLSEYLALGRPVVAYDLPEHRVTCADAARYAKPNDPLDLARTILDLANDEAARKDMSTRGIERARTELAWAHQVPNLLRVYETVGAL